MRAMRWMLVPILVGGLSGVALGEFKNLQAAGLAKAPGRGNARHRRRRGRRLTRPATLQ